MFDNYYKTERLVKLYQAEVMRQVHLHRLAKTARAARPARRVFYARLLAGMGGQLVQFGQSLQDRYGDLEMNLPRPPDEGQTPITP